MIFVIQESVCYGVFIWTTLFADCCPSALCLLHHEKLWKCSGFGMVYATEAPVPGFDSDNSQSERPRGEYAYGAILWMIRKWEEKQTPEERKQIRRNFVHRYHQMHKQKTWPEICKTQFSFTIWRKQCFGSGPFCPHWTFFPESGPGSAKISETDPENPDLSTLSKT